MDCPALSQQGLASGQVPEGWELKTVGGADQQKYSRASLVGQNTTVIGHRLTAEPAAAAAG